MQQALEILDFWFGNKTTLAEQIELQSPLWWEKSADTDNEIRRRFGECFEALLRGELESWRQSASCWLAMIILADQFSRNLFRDSARAFEQDELALSLCLEGIELGLDLQLDLLQRVFFYLPLEHCESLEMQERCLQKMQELVDLAPTECREEFEGFHGYALAHYEVIEKYGRFPHRNQVLGRESTQAEELYLSEPGAGF